jgi:hypothetical protein
MKNTSQSQNRLKWQITKYDSLKFSLKVRVKNSKCSSILLLRQMFLRIQDPEIPLFSRSEPLVLDWGTLWFTSDKATVQSDSNTLGLDNKPQFHLGRTSECPVVSSPLYCTSDNFTNEPDNVRDRAILYGLYCGYQWNTNNDWTAEYFDMYILMLALCKLSRHKRVIWMRSGNSELGY